MAPYNAQIPQPTDKLSNSQPQILANFQALSNIASQTAPYLLFPAQGSDPSTAAATAGLYSKVGANGLTELTFRRESNGDGLVPDPIPFTVYGQNQDATSAGTFGQGGYTRLPSGILLKWGSWTMQAPGTSQVVTFPSTTSTSGQPQINSAIPNFQTAIYNVSVSVLNGSAASYGSVSAVALGTPSTFTVVFPASSTYVIRYFAVGI